jgi:hypothetical protein
MAFMSKSRDGVVRDSNSGEGTIFSLLHTRQDRPWGPPSLLYNGYQGSFQGVKMGRAIPLAHLYACTGTLWDDLYLYQHFHVYFFTMFNFEGPRISRQ